IGSASNWGVVGSATPNGWNGPDLVLYQTGTANVYQGYVNLTDGEIKFRPDNTWGSDFGDNGNNIGVTAGIYKVTINTDNKTFTLESDQRAMFHTDGQNLEIESIPTFTDGYAITKFKNVDRNGDAGSDTSGNFTDMDFPLFRLADVYLMYAEAVKQGGSGGSEGQALIYLNDVRKRANAVPVSSLTLDLILNERGRELYWEGSRRTDLIRFGRFSSGSYVWPWKGGVADGVSTPAYLDLYPIPATDINANPNLTQNDGY
ncbi:MAG: RagB/SusD family nutrient uptake outer membrane protein, partial [Saprospiraceae bacterium]|nr:RagB/SusD family nutrient uptake outer membrane protein [Saprospiraceae bacterium]